MENKLKRISVFFFKLMRSQKISTFFAMANNWPFTCNWNSYAKNVCVYSLWIITTHIYMLMLCKQFNAEMFEKYFHISFTPANENEKQIYFSNGKFSWNFHNHQHNSNRTIATSGSDEKRLKCKWKCNFYNYERFLCSALLNR